MILNREDLVTFKQGWMASRAMSQEKKEWFCKLVDIILARAENEDDGRIEKVKITYPDDCADLKDFKIFLDFAEVMGASMHGTQTSTEMGEWGKHYSSDIY